MKTARYAALAVAFLTPATWLAMLLGCVKYGDTWPQTCEPVNFAAAPLAIGALVLLPIGLTYVERARRRASKGMWLRGLGLGRSFERVAKMIWGSELGPGAAIVGEARFTRRRWLIPVANGQRVWVDRREFWLWLNEVEALHRRLPPGESAIGERIWKPKLKEGRYLAYCRILEAVGRCEYPTDDPRSRRYVPGLAWSACESFELIQESEEY